MEQSKLDLTLKLKPIQTHSTYSEGVINDDATDNWLQNSDQNILKDFSNDISAPLNSAVEQLSSNEFFNKQSYQVHEIIIKEAAGTYQLHLPQGPVNLENGDVILTSIGAFEVAIEKKQIIVNPDPKVDSTYALANAVDDIWNTPLQAAAPVVAMNASHMDPFAIHSSSQNQSLDPLTFLYGEHQSVTPSQFMPGVIPQAEGIGALPYDPIAAMGSPMPTMPMQQASHDALNVHTASHFQPSHSAQSTLQSAQTHNTNEGNILQDLGMSEQSSAIANIHSAEQMPLTATQNVLTEQSPIDMLDEYLGEEPNLHAQSMLSGQQMPMNSNFPNSVMLDSLQRGEQASLLGAIKGFKKKILG